MYALSLEPERVLEAAVHLLIWLAMKQKSPLCLSPSDTTNCKKQCKRHRIGDFIIHVVLLTDEQTNGSLYIAGPDPCRDSWSGPIVENSSVFYLVVNPNALGTKDANISVDCTSGLWSSWKLARQKWLITSHSMVEKSLGKRCIQYNHRESELLWRKNYPSERNLGLHLLGRKLLGRDHLLAWWTYVDTGTMMLLSSGGRILQKEHSKSQTNIKAQPRDVGQVDWAW